MNRLNHPPLPDSMSEGEVQRLLDEVFEGMRSVRRAAADLGWTTDAVQLVIWGDIRQ